MPEGEGNLKKNLSGTEYTSHDFMKKHILDAVKKNYGIQTLYAQEHGAPNALDTLSPIAQAKEEKTRLQQIRDAAYRFFLPVIDKSERSKIPLKLDTFSAFSALEKTRAEKLKKRDVYNSGLYTRLLTFFRIQLLAPELGRIFIVSNRGPIGYECVQKEDGKEVYEEKKGTGGVTVALRSFDACGLRTTFLSAPMSQDDRDADSAKKENKFISVKENREMINNSLLLIDSIIGNRGDKQLLKSIQSNSDKDVPIEKTVDSSKTMLVDILSNLKILRKRGALDKKQDHEFIPIKEDDYETYYKFSSDFIYHLLLGKISFRSISSQIHQLEEDWKSYTKVNQIVANTQSDKISEERGKKPIVMIQDYHLLPASRMLREKHPDIVLQQFIHTPWPKLEVWNALLLFSKSIGKNIYEGMSGNDIIGFQTKEYATNFLNGVQVHLPDAKVDFEKSTVRWNGRETQVRVYPISIDVDETRMMANEGRRKIENTESIQDSPQMQTIVSVDRMDPAKNNMGMLEAFALMLEEHPELRGTVTYKPRLVPSRESIPAYVDLKNAINAKIKEINQQYGNSEWTPVQPDVGNDHKHALGQMASADVVVVASKKDGMNMVALEASAVMHKGVLVLSEKAGAYEHLKDGVLKLENPGDIKEIANRMFEALKMSPEERQRKTAMARNVVENQDLFLWIFAQVNDLHKVGQRRDDPDSSR